MLSLSDSIPQGTSAVVERLFDETVLHVRLLEAAVAGARESLAGIELLTDAMAEQAVQPPRQMTRYARHSAGLPRLGEAATRASIGAVTGLHYWAPDPETDREGQGA